MVIWSKADGPDQLKSREIRRNCGQLLGSVDDLLPFLYIAQYGGPGRALRVQWSPSHPGLFAVGHKTAWGEGMGIAPRVGLVLPLSLCRNEQTKAVLQAIPALIEHQAPGTLPDRRQEVQSKLDLAFRGTMTVASSERLDRFFALASTPALFRQLHEEFEYVTEVHDNPAGAVRITGSSRFPWRSQGELMEWYYGLGGQRPWTLFVPFFVFGDVGALTRYYAERWARDGLAMPFEDPPKWFVIRSDLPNSDVSIRLEMGSYGWAYLHLAIGASTLKIRLSNVFDPFDDLVAWSRKVDDGDLPVKMEIDEEGAEKVLTVLRTNDPDRVLFRISEAYASTVPLEGIVSRTALARGLKDEIRRFFEAEFNPEHWDEQEPAEDFIPTKDRVLGHSWFNAA